MPPTSLPEAAALAESFTEQIDARMNELKPFVDEFDGLAEMRARVTGKPVTGRKPTAGSNGSGRSRAPQGSRLEQFIQVVTDNPGITVSDAAKKMDVQPNYLYRQRDIAVEKGAIRQDDDKKLHPVA